MTVNWFELRKLRPTSTSGRRALRQTPEVPHKVQPVEDCLVHVPRVRPPIAIEPIRVPRKSELDEFFYQNGCSWLASTQPSRNVLLRPEEIHRCLGEWDVVHPFGGRDHAMDR